MTDLLPSEKTIEQPILEDSAEATPKEKKKQFKKNFKQRSCAFCLKKCHPPWNYPQLELFHKQQNTKEKSVEYRQEHPETSASTINTHEYGGFLKYDDAENY